MYEIKLMLYTLMSFFAVLLVLSIDYQVQANSFKSEGVLMKYNGFQKSLAYLLMNDSNLQYFEYICPSLFTRALTKQNIA